MSVVSRSASARIARSLQSCGSATKGRDGPEGPSLPELAACPARPGDLLGGPLGGPRVGGGPAGSAGVVEPGTEPPVCSRGGAFGGCGAALGMHGPGFGAALTGISEGAEEGAAEAVASEVCSTVPPRGCLLGVVERTAEAKDPAGGFLGVPRPPPDVGGPEGARLAGGTLCEAGSGGEDLPELAGWLAKSLAI